ncbi:MmgE/PrpD family protein [Tateyamaria pelophila]|uniref:MmgE/PrpD family protein n=1 Tax=Tateyamaria pelophila TaxID=328415 RepID=UPI001CBE7725|nr:MmgE/PrpD family protein [Tateyamaria pelophila]
MIKSEPYLESELIRFCQRPVAPEAALRARFTVLDWLGCVFAARHSEVAHAMGRAQHVPNDDIVRAGLSSTKYDAQTAVLWLGTLGNVLEMDDLHRASILHPGDAIVPAALAVALRQLSTGLDLLAALTRGYEAAIRIGRVAASGGYTSFYNSSTCGVFGAAIAASDLLHGSMADALGQAGMMASGIWQCRLEPTFSKQLATAQAARSGVLAAELAAAGFPGARAILTGPMGFFASYYPKADTAQLIAPGDWALHEMSFKPFPACRHTHPAISAAMNLREGGTAPRRMTIETYSAAIDFCDAPHPTTPEDARFSLQHTVAVALSKGAPNIADFDTDALNDPNLTTLRDRVELKVAPDLDAAFPQSYGARIRIEAQDGRVRDATCPAAWGDPENPMQEADIIAKFHTNAAYGGLSAPQADRILQAVLALPDAPDLSALQSALDAAFAPTPEFP